VPAFVLAGAAAGWGSTSRRSEAVTISIIEHQPPRVALLKKMLPAFERTHPNIKVKLQEGPAPDTEFQTKLTLDLNAGHAADVMALSFAPTDVAASGYLLNLTSLVNGWSGWQRFYPRLRRDEAIDGKIYTVPREASVQQFFYRKDILTKLHVSTSQPQSWKELMSRLTALKDAMGGPSIVFPAGKAWGGGTFGEGFINLMMGTSSKLYDTSAKKWIVRSPGLTQVLQFYLDLTRTGVLDIPPLLNPEPWTATKYDAFPKGKLAVSTGGTWSWFFDWGPKGSGPIPNVFQKVATWNYPAPNGGASYVPGATGWRWAISAKSKHPKEAFELVKWLASPAFIAQNSVTIGAISPRNDVRTKPYTTYPVLINAEKQLAKARSFNSPVGTDRMIQVVDDVTEAIITKKVTDAKSAADQFVQEATRLLGRSKVEEKP